MKRLPLLRPLLLLGPILVQAQPTPPEEAPPLPGHSLHGEVFNEGPRQAAVLIPGTGEVHLEVTTSSEEARQFFRQGVGQLHGYWYFEAERSFRQAAALDPDCAMAYWGMAMANFKNDRRGQKFIEEAVARKARVSPREQLWIDSLAAYFKDPKADAQKRLRAYVRALEKLLVAHPGEVEAEAFLLHQVFYNSGKELPISSHYAMDLLAQKILAKHPRHPAHHFRIHLWDKAEPERALEAAAKCGPAAPAIAHMWHMPGHIYSGLKRYADAAWHQEASARVDHAHMIRYQIVPDQIHNFAHNNEWLIRNYHHLGQYRQSVALALNMISLPRLPNFRKEGDQEVYDPDKSSWQYGRQRLRDTLFRFEEWEKLIAHSGDGQDRQALLHPDGKSITDTDYHRHVGIAKFESGDHPGGLRHLEELEKVLKAKEAERDRAVEEAARKAQTAGKDDKGIEAAQEAAGRSFEKAIAALEPPVHELRVYAALTADPPDVGTALTRLPQLKQVEKWRLATLWQRAGKVEEALRLAKEAVSAGPNEVLPLTVQVRLLHTQGLGEEAKAAFEQLRQVAHAADLDLKIFAPLAPIAAALGFPEDWRRAPAPPTDIGERPELDQLGPALWSPPPSPSMTLLDAEGRTQRLAPAGPHPRLILFYLGKGCSHCLEQLQVFAPLQARYHAAGIELMAVSPDSPDALRETRPFTEETPETGPLPFPFPLYGDPEMTAFRAFRAYDDFEDLPLHGAFLVDAQGRIRWQDIGHEPFTKGEWLLEECQRLLASEGTVAVSSPAN